MFGGVVEARGNILGEMSIPVSETVEGTDLERSRSQAP